MKVVVVIDSFKGSLSSLEAGRRAEEGIKRVDPLAKVVVKPLVDGGEGTVDALVEGMKGKKEMLTVKGPLGAPVQCEYGILEEEKTAIIEMAGAAGLTLIKKEERNPELTSTYGVGEVILDAIQKGCRRFIVGIGGSATNDGGVGMLKALGYEFLDERGDSIKDGAIGLRDLSYIKKEEVDPRLKECEFFIACDVNNPLCGETGCSAVYGPQKGADEAMVKRMDLWMQHYAKVVKEAFPKAEDEAAGAGAAGGLGFAFLAFTNAVLESGIQIVMKEIRLEEALKDADLVITGEGRLDGQTAMGKAPVGVAKLAKTYHLPVLAFAGSVTKEAKKCNDNGIDAYFPILRTIATLEEAMDPETAGENLADTVEQVMRLYTLEK